ncbi:MAG: S1 family peptidase [Actinomycetes bacterium]
MEFARGITGKHFAGVWMATSGDLGFRVNVVKPTAAEVIRLEAAFTKVGVSGAVVGVSYSEGDLDQVRRYLTAGLSSANRRAPVPISLGDRTDLNAVLIVTPTDSHSTSAQRRFVYRAITRFSGRVRLAAGNFAPITLPCRSVFCDPPLRGGVFVYGGFSGCTGGFIVRSRLTSKPYLLTAGHCQVLWDRTWLTDFANGTVHRIGAIRNRRFDLLGDAGIVAIDNPAGWKPRAWVAVRQGLGATTNYTYAIRSDSIPVVGGRVCVSGAGSRASNCGLVTRTGVTVTFADLGVTVANLAEASFCTQPGDSGAPVFSNHVAYGTVSGSRGPCISLFQPVGVSETLLNVNVAHDAG